MATYSFTDVTASLTGPTGDIDLGYGSTNADEGIDTSMVGDKNTMTTGASKEGMHSLHSSDAGTVSLRYLKTAPNNALLMAMYDAQKASAALWGQNVIIIRQTQSGDVTTALQCAFKKKPDIKYAKEGDILVWTFDSISIDTVLGQY